MDKLREQFKKLTSLDTSENLSKTMLEKKNITWYSQLSNKQSEKELCSLLKRESIGSSISHQIWNQIGQRIPMLKI